MQDIIIIGGGITGCASAWNLARSGRKVRLLERHHIAAMASGWTLGGVRQSGRDPAELPLASAAVALWPQLSELLGYDTGYAQHGNLRLARNRDEAALLREMVKQQNALGLSLSFLEGNRAVRDLAPALSGQVQAASFCPSDGFADPVAATAGFARASEQYGARVDQGISVESVALSKGRVCGVETSSGFIATDCVIVAAGTHSPNLLAPLGLTLPLKVTKVQVVQTEVVPPCFNQVFGVANADCAGRQEPNGRFRFTSGLFAFDGDPDRWSEALLLPSDKDKAALRARVAEVLPAAACAAVSRVWGGLIDLTPDALPVIDAPRRVPGLIIAAGFSGHGFGIGPISGRLVAELAQGLDPFLSTRAFALDRFQSTSMSPAQLTLHG